MTRGRCVSTAEVLRRLTAEQQDQLPEYVEYWAKDRLLFCQCCGWTWTTGPVFLPFCPNCSGDGPRD